MILKESTHSVEKSGVSETSSFKIKASAKAFQILSSSLYGDKVTAVLRELSTNSFDAHITMGNPNPFKIHLPNSLEPFLLIKDYGTGLSDEDVKEIYTTYFESTKTSSNDVCGALGIGGKVWAAYTDCASISSRFNGTVRNYSMYIDSNGCPAVSLLNESPTDEPNGLEVSIAVNPKDFNEFYSKAAKVFSRFNPKPIVSGVKDFVIPDPKYKMRGDKWALVENGYTSNRENKGAVAVMGCVGYSIDSLCNNSEVPYDLQQIANNPLDLFFDIGELEVAASRETLSFDKRTLACVLERLQKIKDEIPVRVQKEVSGAKSLWEARIKAREMGREFSNFNVLGSTLSWGNQAIDTGDVNIRGIGEVLHFYHNHSYTNKVVKNRTYCISPEASTIIVENDLQKGLVTRVRKYIRENKNKEIIILEQGRPKIIAALGLTPDQIIKASTLPKPTYARNSTISEKGKAKILIWEGGGYYDNDSWEAATAKPEDGGIYIPIQNYKHANGWSAQSFIKQWTDRLKDFEIEPAAPIYGIKYGYVDKFLKAGQWKTLDSYVKDEIAKKVKSEEFKRAKANFEDYNAVSGFPFVEVVNNIPNSLCAKIRIFKNSLRKATTKLDKGIDKKVEIARNLNIPVEISKEPTFELEKQYIALMRDYPMLKYVGKDVDIKDVQEYISQTKKTKHAPTKPRTYRSSPTRSRHQTGSSHRAAGARI